MFMKVVASCLLITGLLAQTAIVRPSPGKFKLGYRQKVDETEIVIFGESDTAWAVGVSTTTKADMASVDVFYEYVDGRLGKLYLHKNSHCPVAGPDGFGATDQNFSIPLRSVIRVHVTFLKVVGLASFE